MTCSLLPNRALGTLLKCEYYMFTNIQNIPHILKRYVSIHLAKKVKEHILYKEPQMNALSLKLTNNKMQTLLTNIDLFEQGLEIYQYRQNNTSSSNDNA